MSKRTYLVVGSGGREHAIAWKLSQSNDCSLVYIAPGNAGIGIDPEISGDCIAIDICDFDALAKFAEDHEVDLTIVGPEKPLVEGIVDYFQARSLPIIGPNRTAARLESSKAFAKEIMQAAGIPTAPYKVFEFYEEAIRYISVADHPLIIKADGLAGGKGTVKSNSKEDSRRILDEYMRHEKFGIASKRVVIEECLIGSELSFIVLTDGTAVVDFPVSRDYKCLYDDNIGPNTGGMGAVVGTGIHFDDKARQEILNRIIRPLLKALKSRQIDYCGILYIGLMLTKSGPQVLEFNVRLGDPETQAILMAADLDLGSLFMQAVNGTLNDNQIEATNDTCCIVATSSGYPFTNSAPVEIAGIDIVEMSTAHKIFYGAVEFDEKKSKLYAKSGRILSVVTRAKTCTQANQAAYESMAKIDWDGMHYRSDIGSNKPA